MSEAMCQKQREELNRYKAHVSDLSSQLWTLGEKLIIEQKHREDATQRCKELQTKLKEMESDQAVATISRKTCTYVQLYQNVYLNEMKRTLFNACLTV